MLWYAAIMAPEGMSAEHELPWERPVRRAAARVPHLVLAWSLDEPARIGESIAVQRSSSFGRGEPLPDDPAPRVMPRRMRPAGTALAVPVANARIARLHLLLEPDGEGGVRVVSRARSPVRVNGRPIDVG